MLRVLYDDSAVEQRWILCGDLAGPWVDELRSSWQYYRRFAPRARVVVDLSDVSFIDDAGETLLSEMDSAGTEFIATGADHRHMLANLKNTGVRPLRRAVEHLGSVCGTPRKAEGEE